MADQEEQFSIEGKVILVTGGAAGVGAALVRVLLWEDAQAVIFLDIAEHEGMKLERELWQKYGSLRSKFIKCDVSDERSFSDAFQHVIDKYRRLDVVINGAAVISADEHDYKKIIETNFTGTVSSTLRGLKTMDIEKGGSGGCIVNISSLLALTPTCQLPVYTSTKIAVLKFSNAIGVDEHYSKTKVRVVAVCLGPTDTAILQRQNAHNFNQDCQGLTSRVHERQRVESAALGIIEAIKNGKSGSTWKVADDRPAEDISTIVAISYGKFEGI